MNLVAATLSLVKPRAGATDASQVGRTVLARLPRGRFTPPVAVEHDIPRIVRDDAVRVVPVDLVVEVHVGDGQVLSFTLTKLCSAHLTP